VSETAVVTAPARLVRIQHDRCNDYDGTEYVLAPADWDDDKIRTEIRAACGQMIKDAQQVSESPLKPPWTPPYDAHPDKTVAEVKGLHAEQQATYKAWQEENGQLTRSLQERLRERGFFALWDDEQDEKTGVVHVEQYWGHQHGLTLNYEHMKG
jgi:hypothetical protein